jgi:hypothetical protein
MKEEKELIIKCDKCKLSKPENLFYKYKYCKRCHIINYINIHLLNARVANHLNLSIDELNNILINDMNDPTRNEIGEHYRYDEVMLYMLNMPSSMSITENDINNFLDK